MAKMMVATGDQAFLLELAFRWHLLAQDVESVGSARAIREAQSLADHFERRFH
jgi:hypothetical protein